MTALEALAPVERHTLASKVYLDLRELIMSGRLAPGDRLSLRTVAGALGVSVMPVRDAVNRLVAEQALLTSPNRGFFVPRMTPDEFRELAMIRVETEGFAVEQAVLRHDLEDLEQIRREERVYRELCLTPVPDLAAAIESNMRLHFIVYRAARMPRLLGIIEALWLRAGPLIVLETRSSPGRLVSGGSYQRHAEMLAAMEAGDAKAARAAIAADIQATATYILNGDCLLQEGG